MNAEELKQFSKGLHERLDKTVKVPLSPAMIVLLAQIKGTEKQSKTRKGRSSPKRETKRRHAGN